MAHLDEQRLLSEKQHAFRKLHSCETQLIYHGDQTGSPLCQVSLLFSLHINDIISDIKSEIRLFADDCVCYREIKDIEDTLKLQ